MLAAARSTTASGEHSAGLLPVTAKMGRVRRSDAPGARAPEAVAASRPGQS